LPTMFQQIPLLNSQPSLPMFQPAPIGSVFQPQYQPQYQAQYQPQYQPQYQMPQFQSGPMFQKPPIPIGSVRSMPLQQFSNPPAYSSNNVFATTLRNVQMSLQEKIEQGQQAQTLQGVIQNFFKCSEQLGEMEAENPEQLVDYGLEEKRLAPNGRDYPIQQLDRKKNFCRTDDKSCLRCQSDVNNTTKFGSSNGSSNPGSSSSPEKTSEKTSEKTEEKTEEKQAEKQAEGLLIPMPSTTVLMPVYQLPDLTCGFCYVHYKRHCQKLGNRWPRIEDEGFWHGHSTKDEFGNVACPELRAMMCPLCFASGSKAHTEKFCPLMNPPQELTR